MNNIAKRYFELSGWFYQLIRTVTFSVTMANDGAETTSAGG